MEGGMPPGMTGAPPIDEFSWMVDGPGASSGSSAGSSDTGDGMGDAMGDAMGELPYQLTGDFWAQQATESSSWSPGDDASSLDSDSESSHGYSSGSDVIAGGQGTDLFDMGFGGSTSPSSELYDSEATSSTGDDGWPGLGGGWLAMDLTDTSSSCGAYSTVAPPVVGQVAHAQPIAAAMSSWGVGADMVANPAVQPKRGHPSLSSGDVPAKRPRAGVAAPAVAEPRLAPLPEQPAPAPGGSMPPGQTLRWEEALDLLDRGIMVPRPSHLQLFPGSFQQVFLERPVQKRKKGEDKWVGSGGRKGSTEYWMGEVGVRKRYGRVTCDVPGMPAFKYAHYTRLRQKPGSGGGDSAAEEDKSVALYVAIPPTGPQVEPPARAHEAGEAVGASIPLPVSRARARAPSDGAARRQGRSSATGMHTSAAAAASLPLNPKRERIQALPARVVPAPHVFTATAGDDLSAALTVQAGVGGEYTTTPHQRLVNSLR